MRRWWGLASLLCAVIAAPAGVQAQPADVSASADVEPAAAAPPQTIVYGAMPGGMYVDSAETLPAGVVQVSTLTGLGRRTQLLGKAIAGDPMSKDSAFNRLIGDLAVGYGVSQLLSLGLSLDGRYDRHWGPYGRSGDDNYVGDPHLLARIGKKVGANHFGAAVDIWLPGSNAPSLVAGAISVDVRGLATLAVGPAQLSINAGFKLDNSRASTKGACMGGPDTNISCLSIQDQVSLGVSDYNEVEAGAQIGLPLSAAGKAFVSIEGSLEAFLGSATAGDGALKEGSMTLRGGIAAGMHLNDQWSLLAFVEGAKVPGIEQSQITAKQIPIIPYEPAVTGGIGLEARFGGPKRSALYTEKDCHKHNPPDCPAVKVPLTADISGTVVDQTDKPLVGAKVSLTLKNSQVPGVATDDKGSYVFKGVPIGNSVDNKPTIEETGIEVSVALDGKKPGKATIASVQQGANTVAPIKLEPVLPPGQLKVSVRALTTGKAIVGATITVTPGDQKFETGPDGNGQLDLAPGQYKITVKAPGLASQELDVTIDPEGVAIKNIDLHK